MRVVVVAVTAAVAVALASTRRAVGLSLHSLQTAKQGAWFCASKMHASRGLGGLPPFFASRSFFLWRCSARASTDEHGRAAATILKGRRGSPAL